MKSITHKINNQRLKHAYKVADERELKAEIYRIKHGKDKIKVSTTKKVLAFLIANMMLIEIYSLYVMFILGDLNALQTLITSVVAECVAVLGYMVKSSIENKAGGITYELAMKSVDEMQDPEIKG